MKRRITDLLARHRSLLLRLPFAVLVFPALPAEPLSPVEYSWDNPAFRERFTATYGVLSAAEPPVDPADRTFLREQVLPRIGTAPEEARQLVAERLQESASPALYFLLGNLNLELGDFDQARRALDRALALYPDFRRAHRSAALLEVRSEDYPASVPHWLEVIRLGGGDDQSYGLLAYAYLQEGRWTAAARAFENALVHNPQSRDLRRGLVQAYLQNRRGAEAAELIRRLLAEDPSDPQMWGLLANQTLDEGNLVRTAAALETAARIAGASPERLLLLGGVYTSLGLPGRALSAYERLLEFPASDLSFEDAVAPLDLLLEQREWPLAERYARRLQQYFGRDLDSFQSDRINAGLVTARLYRSPDDETARTAEAYAERFPLDGLLALALGDYRASIGQPAEALLAYRLAATSDRHRYEATLRLANLLVAEGRISEAIRRFRELQELQYRAEVARFLNRLEEFAER